MRSKILNLRGWGPTLLAKIETEVDKVLKKNNQKLRYKDLMMYQKTREIALFKSNNRFRRYKEMLEFPLFAIELTDKNEIYFQICQ